MSPAPTGKSIEKPASSTSVPKKVAEKPVKDIKKSGMKPRLEQDFQKFYEDMTEPIELFSQCLAEGDIESCTNNIM